MFRLGALVIAVAVVSASCGGDEAAQRNSGGAPSEVTGPIIDIDSEGLEHVAAFTVKDGTETYEIRIAPEIDYGFPLSHLNEHRLSGAPVRVRIDERKGELFALSIVDA